MRETDAFVSKKVEEMSLLAENLAMNQHPDPAAYINNLDVTTTLPDLFKKYTVGKQYYNYYPQDYDIAMQYADSTLRLFEDQDNIVRYRMYYLYAILSKEDVLRRKHLYGSSIQHLLQGWGMIDPIATPCIASQYLGRLGSLSYLQGDFYESIEYYNRSRNSSIECEEDRHFTYYRTKFQYLQNIAANYSQLEKPDSSLHYINLSMEVIENEMTATAVSENEHHFTQIARGVALGNQANEMAKISMEYSVEPLWKESIQINLQPGFANEHAQFMRLHLARYYTFQDRADEAKELLDLVRNWLDNNSSETGEKRWLEVYTYWLESQGDFVQAYSVYQQFVEMENSLSSSRRELDKLDLRNQILLLENQNQLDILHAQSQLRNVYLIFSIVISLLFLVIAFLIWRSLKMSQNHVASLSELNHTISKKNLELEKTNRAVSKIINIVNHDLRSPLAGVREISAFMMTDENLREDQRNWAKTIHTTMKQSLNLANDILRLKLDSKSFDNEEIPLVDKKCVHLNDFLNDCIKVIRLKAKKKNQKIHLVSIPDVQVCINIDDMTRVIYNVIDNAIKFSAEHSPIYVRAQVELSKVIISIEDEGVGMPQPNRKDIFEMSALVQREGTNNEESYGIGLAISKTIVEAHNGKIWFESNDPVGSILFIELPANINEES